MKVGTPAAYFHGRLAAVLAMLLAAGISVMPARAVASTPMAPEILRRAEEVRSPDLDYALDFTIAVLDDYSPGIERKASYTMVAHGKDQTLVMMITPEQFYGGMLLIRDGAYWLLMPRAKSSLQLSAEQVLRGDIANGDLARANLLSDYEARLDGEERLEGERCWRLDLTPRAGVPGRYSRIRMWIGKKGFLPRKFEYYGKTGAFLKAALYRDYQKTALGLRSMRMEVDNPGEMHRKTTMVFTHLRRIDASPVRFTPEGIVSFRDAAQAKLDTDGVAARPEDVLAALAAAAKS